MKYSYLALGDSYTIGEKVLFAENFPNQVVQIMREKGFEMAAPEIIAKTGWTTDELQTAINQYQFKEKYDFVSLLIGVNNQYRGLPIKDYTIQFESLLNQSIHFADSDSSSVVVISIPDWGVTPFAKDRNRQQIANEIDNYNSINRRLTEKYKIHYIDITKWTREADEEPSLLAVDGLHPSGKEYFRWAQKIASYFTTIIPS
jgi:lysophospholipase L1-like esterase